MSWRAAIGVTTVAGVAIALTAIVANAGQAGLIEAPAVETAAPESEDTARVERRDLVISEDVDGTLGHGEPVMLAGPAEGTVTELPAEGSVVGFDQSLWQVDARPTVLLPGTTPMWRDLNTDSEGVDVLQLETALRDLGYGTDDEFTVDDDYTSATADIVERWQEAHGVEETGTVLRTDVVFSGEPLRVAEHPTRVGAAVSGDLLGVTGTSRHVTVDLPARHTLLATVGDAVEIELPDDSVIPGTIDAVASAIDLPEQEGEDATLALTIGVDETAVAWLPDGAPVVVSLVEELDAGALAVPVEALLALAEGGYAVEIVEDGDRRLVGVELGTSADGWVAVQGDLTEGAEVVVAQ